MTIKTPEEVAREVVLSEYGLPHDDYPTAEDVLEAVMDARDGQTAEDIIDTIRVAIEADRAQRTDIEALREEALTWAREREEQEGDYGAMVDELADAYFEGAMR